MKVGNNQIYSPAIYKLPPEVVNDVIGQLFKMIKYDLTDLNLISKSFSEFIKGNRLIYWVSCEKRAAIKARKLNAGDSKAELAYETLMSKSPLQALKQKIIKREVMYNIDKIKYKMGVEDAFDHYKEEGTCLTEFFRIKFLINKRDGIDNDAHEFAKLIKERAYTPGIRQNIWNWLIRTDSQIALKIFEILIGQNALKEFPENIVQCGLKKVYEICDSYKKFHREFYDPKYYQRMIGEVGLDHSKLLFDISASYSNKFKVCVDVAIDLHRDEVLNAANKIKNYFLEYLRSPDKSSSYCEKLLSDCCYIYGLIDPEEILLLAKECNEKLSLVKDRPFRMEFLSLTQISAVIEGKNREVDIEKLFKTTCPSILHNFIGIFNSENCKESALNVANNMMSNVDFIPSEEFLFFLVLLDADQVLDKLKVKFKGILLFHKHLSLGLKFLDNPQHSLILQKIGKFLIESPELGSKISDYSCYLLKIFRACDKHLHWGESLTPRFLAEVEKAAVNNIDLSLWLRKIAYEIRQNEKTGYPGFF